jgi:predicted site-specific integrase-resolvase
LPDIAPLLDCREAAQRLHVSVRTVRRYGKSGLLDERRVGPWLIRFTEASVEALIAAPRNGTEAPATSAAPLPSRQHGQH